MSFSDENVVRMQPAEDRLRLAFYGWQCRLRQLAVREQEARPTPGMRPTLEVAGQDGGAMTVVIVPAEPEASTIEFRHIVRRTHDPRERYQAALRLLQSTHFQDPTAFDDRLTAVFGAGGELAEQLSGRDDCVLIFEQFSQCYRLPCKAEALDPDHPAFQATYWHNALFNPSLPAEVRILSFQPDWSRADADPSPI